MWVFYNVEFRFRTFHHFIQKMGSYCRKNQKSKGHRYPSDLMGDMQKKSENSSINSASPSSSLPCPFFFPPFKRKCISGYPYACPFFFPSNAGPLLLSFFFTGIWTAYISLFYFWVSSVWSYFWVISNFLGNVFVGNMKLLISYFCESKTLKLPVLFVGKQCLFTFFICG